MTCSSMQLILKTERNRHFNNTRPLRFFGLPWQPPFTVFRTSYTTDSWVSPSNNSWIASSSDLMADLMADRVLVRRRPYSAFFGLL